MIGPDTKTIILVGAGKMGGAMLTGWLEKLDSTYVFHVIDPGAGAHLNDLQMRLGDKAIFSHYETADALPPDLAADVVILATKPQLVSTALQLLSGHLQEGALVVCVAAGVGIAALQSDVDNGQTAVRVMPNIGALLGYSVSAGFAPDNTTAAHRSLVVDLFTAIGSFTWLEDESQMHAVTALSGSGPAYVFAMCEAMIAAAIAQGLNEATAKELAIGTICAAGRLLEDNPDPTSLREAVTSPNGTTQAGLAALAKDGALDGLMVRTIAAARDRSIALS